MDSYTVTITPNDDSGNRTTLTVDTSADQVRITDVHLHATGGLTGGQMPSIDFGLLLKALARPANSPAAIAAAPAEPAPAYPAAADVDEPAVAVTAPLAAETQHADDEATPLPAPELARKRSNPRRATAARGAKGKAAATEEKPARRKPARAHTKAITTGAITTASKERVYRRMPEDFGDVYRQASTAAAIVDHYGVPRHTAQGWIRRFKATDTAAGN